MNSPEALQTESPIPCPLCQKLFRLPTGFTSANALACPHCEKQVTGQQIMDAVAPTAKIVERPEPVATGTPKIEPETGARPARSFDQQDFVIPKPLKTATRRSRSHHPERQNSTSRSKKKRSSKKEQPSAGAEMMKIAFGGILALPIAQLVLWWAFNTDPLNLAPTTSRVASFVVPPKLRPTNEVEQVEEKQDKDMPGTQKLHDDKIPSKI